MEFNPIIVSIATFALLILMAVGLYFLTKWLLGKKQGYPFEKEIEAALKAILLAAIAFAYKTSERLADAGLDRLRGIDKAKLAAWLYSRIPDLANVYGIPFPTWMIKKLVPAERFAELVQEAFDEFTEFFEDTHNRFGEELDELLGV